jgi:flagellar basal-body rod protein FlgB
LKYSSKKDGLKMPIPTNKTLETLLDFTAIKQKVIGQNIANAETKNYKRKEVEFKELLDLGMKKSSNVNQKETEFSVKLDEETQIISQGNNVDINKEMADLAKNTIMFKFASNKISGYYKTLQNVIRGGN